MQGVLVPSLFGELSSHMPLGQKIKTQNRSNIATNSIKTSKIFFLNLQKFTLLQPPSRIYYFISSGLRIYIYNKIPQIYLKVSQFGEPLRHNRIQQGVVQYLWYIPYLQSKFICFDVYL